MVVVGYAFFVLFHAVGVAVGTETRNIKNWEMGGAPLWGGHRLMGESDNQPNDSAGDGGGVWKQMRPQYKFQIKYYGILIWKPCASTEG